MGPIIRPARLLFTEDVEGISWCDSAIADEIDEEIADCGTLGDKKFRYIYEYMDGSGSKVLGYPHFTQQDPDRYPKYDTLLFQLDSTDDYVQWADGGVANFFINSEDLKNEDFSDVLFYWDCY